MFASGGDDDPFSGGGGGGGGGGGVNKDSMAEPASATDDQFKRASPSMFQEMVEEDGIKQRDSDEVDFMANQVLKTLEKKS